MDPIDSSLPSLSLSAGPAREADRTAKPEGQQENPEPKKAEAKKTDESEKKDSFAKGELSSSDKLLLARLQQADRSVRAHEAAHKSVGGMYAGGISFGYTTGPDGKRYATSGEVPVDISPVEGDPAATIAKMNRVRAAALAPADPSSADRAIAGRASAQIAKASAELLQLPKDKIEKADQADQKGEGEQGEKPEAGEKSDEARHIDTTA